MKKRVFMELIGTVIMSKYVLIALLLLLSMSSNAQIIKGRFNMNAGTFGNIEPHMVLLEDKTSARVDTLFDDLPIKITLSQEQRKDTSVQHHLLEIAGMYKELAARLGKDRIVTILETDRKDRYPWVYIYYLQKK